MTSSEKNTLFYFGIFGVLAYLAWKLWPTIRRAINSGSGGTSVSGTGASAGSPYYPNDSSSPSSSTNPLQSLLNALSGGGGSGGGSGSGGLGPGAYSSGANSNALDAALSQADANINSEVNDYPIWGASDASVQGVTDGDQIADVPYQNYDVNQNATDLPTSQSTDYTNYDTNDYDTGQIDDGGGGGGSGDDEGY